MLRVYRPLQKCVDISDYQYGTKKNVHTIDFENLMGPRDFNGQKDKTLFLKGRQLVRCTWLYIPTFITFICINVSATWNLSLLVGYNLKSKIRNNLINIASREFCYIFLFVHIMDII